MSEEWSKLISHPEHNVNMSGLDIVVHNKVFTPDSNITYSSSIILDNLPDVREKDILDLGCGTGIVALRCVLNGARNVTAADVSSFALKNTKANLEKFAVENRVNILQSDLFENIDQTFDYIFANLPILDEIWSSSTSTINLLEQFIAEYPAYLNENGCAYVAWGSFADIEPLLACLKAHAVRFEQVAVEKLGYTWTLIKLQK